MYGINERIQHEQLQTSVAFWASSCSCEISDEAQIHIQPIIIQKLENGDYNYYGEDV